MYRGRCPGPVSVGLGLFLGSQIVGKVAMARHILFRISRKSELVQVLNMNLDLAMQH